MNVAVIKTKAEQALVQQFEAVSGSLPGAGWVPAARTNAIGAFATSGLPHRRIEEWKYTDLRQALKVAYPPATVLEPPAPGAVAEALGPELADLACIRMLFVNGRFVSLDAPLSGQPGATYQLSALGAEIGTAAGAWLEPVLGNAGGSASYAGMLALNTAYMTDGALLRVAPGARVALPIHLVFVTDDDNPSATTVRNVIEVGEGATATVLESHVGRSGVARQCNAVTQLDIGDRANVQHLQVLRGSRDATHVGLWDVRIGGEATYRAFQLTASCALARNETVLTYRGAGTKADISGIMLGRGGDHIDTTLTVDHAVPHCESRELFKLVLDDHARGIFQGKVIVRQDAQKSDGKQMAQALMLSEAAEFDSKPELEIYADDVVCGHGSTVAEIDPELVFYCRSRGIPEAQARVLLIDSFVGEAIEKITDDRLAGALSAIATRWLRG